MGELDGRRAIVTGGSSGIGRAAARRFAGDGADVVIGDIDAAAGRALAAELGVGFEELDVGDPEAWERVVARAGPFDIGFLNAGIATGHDRPEGALPVVGLGDGAYRRIMSANVDGVVLGARALLPDMLAAGRGDLVVTASLAGLVPISFDPIYGLTKHAVVGFVRSMAAALDLHATPTGVCISAICPGFTDTAIIDESSKQRITELGLEIMAPDHIADVVMRAIRERVNGAQWVVWPNAPVKPYEWAPAIPIDVSATAVHGTGR